MKNILLILFCLIFLSGCGNSIFLEKEKLNSLKSANQEQSTLFFEKKFQVTDTGQLFEFTHILVQSSENRKSLENYLEVFDSPELKLYEFFARIIKKSGSEKIFSKSDLITQSLSNRNTISEDKVKFIPISDEIEQGDLIEVYYKHENKIPGSGLSFSPEEAGENAKNVSCVIFVPLNIDLNYFVKNDTITPFVICEKENKSYLFEWKSNIKRSEGTVFSKKNGYPIIYATMPILPNKSDVDRIQNWEDYGKYRFSLIQPKIKLNEPIRKLADSICTGFDSPKEKMDAIFNYCQKNIRYEQVYLEKGSIIPNDFDFILNKKYGDCKDYSFLIYTLAKNINIDAKLAVCYRGRGVEFFENIPVHQTNHMIAYCSFDGKDYWYDGTNRIGLAGIPTLDLINQTALIIDKDKSYLKKIEESPDNLLLIEGLLKQKKSNIEGELIISFRSQYAIDFNYVNIYLNKQNMTEYLLTWMKKNINPNVSCKKISWKNQDDKFIIETELTLPNSLLYLNNNYYFSFAKAFPMLLASTKLPEDAKSIFFYPDYSKIKVEIKIENLISETSKTDPIIFQTDIPVGPFQENEKMRFMSDYTSILEKFGRKIKFTSRPIE